MAVAPCLAMCHIRDAQLKTLKCWSPSFMEGSLVEIPKIGTPNNVALILLRSPRQDSSPCSILEQSPPNPAFQRPPAVAPKPQPQPDSGTSALLIDG